ncbi:glycoside hydrolase [Lophiotrema nucula]|uniref:Glycoside hydrolase n=1 Tax=Lophiotrema nucula TaxID=690887 RepID=A0A6A5ZGC4_9PLEO|nr:glycoside hydrolase [Lophiotrema nucula]
MRFVSALTVSLLAALGSCRPAAKRQSGKPIFAHYMIGEIYDEHTRQDIVDAQALGLDAFALNINSLQSWATETVDRLFNNADELGFGLFFSFDIAASGWTSPNDDFASYLKPFLSRTSYFKYSGKPLVSTFGGESISNDQWSSFKSTIGDALLIPGFYEATPSTTFFDGKSSLDGVFNWNTWPYSDQGKATVSTTDDETFITAANSANKLFIMGMSPIQFKHIDTSQSWYRRGENNLEYRIEQALALQPDMIELQTWNDAGESHYMGNLWEEPMTNSPIHTYTDGYNHTGYKEILGAFVQAWKRGDTTTANMVPTNGKTIQGTFWHHTLTVDADCSSDSLAKPQDVINNAEDAVSGVVLVAKGSAGLVAVVNNGDKELGKLTLNEGYNKVKFTGVGAGKVQLEVWDRSTMIGGGYAPLEVAASGSVCNYNFQVVGFPG